MAKSLRETIFHESVRLWEEKGYENVSMRDIAAACDIGTGNLTYYFPKKDDILMYYHEKVMTYAEEIMADMGDALVGLSGYFAAEYTFLYYIVFFVNNLYKQVINVPSLRMRYYEEHHKLYQQFIGRELGRADWAATVAMCNMEFGLTDVDILESEFDMCMEKILETRFIMDKRKPSGWRGELEKGMALGKEKAIAIGKEPPVLY